MQFLPQKVTQKVTPNQNVKYYISSEYDTLKKFVDKSELFQRKAELSGDNILRCPMTISTNRDIYGGFFIIPQHELHNNVSEDICLK